MNRLKEVLIKRDGLSEEEAEKQIAEAKEDLQQCLEEGDTTSAWDICEMHFGLEPDYLEDLVL